MPSRKRLPDYPRITRPAAIAGLVLAGIACAGQPAPAQEPDIPVASPVEDAPAAERMVELEGSLASHLPSSDAAADIMLELLELYRDRGQSFGLVRIARRFTAAHPTHPDHSRVMRWLLDGLRASSNHRDVQTVARQFIDRYPNGIATGEVWRIMARSLTATEDSPTAIAEAWQNAWQHLGHERGNEAGIHAIRWHLERNHSEGFSAATALAKRMATAADDPMITAEIGWQGLQAARRGDLWQSIIDLGSQLQSDQVRNALGTERQAELHSLVGQAHSRLDDHPAAIEQFRKALALLPGRQSYHHHLLHAHSASRRDTRAFAAALRDYRDRFPDSPETAGFAFRLAAALADNDNRPAALKTAAAAFGEYIGSENDVRTYMRWATADDSDGSAAIPPLLEAASRNPDDAWRIHWVLAFDHYRDRLENRAKAIDHVRRMLHDTPSNQQGFEDAVAWLLDNIQDEESFDREIQRLVATANAHPHMHHYGALLGEWIKDAERDPEKRDRVKRARTVYQRFSSQDHIRWWRDAYDDDKQAIEARSALLKRVDLTASQQVELLRRQSHHFRHRLHHNDRHRCLPLFAELADMRPDDISIAADWLEAALSHGKQPERSAALGHMMERNPSEPVPEIERNLLKIAAAPEEPDTATAAKVYDWISSSRRRNGDLPAHSTEIGDLLWSLGLESEAIAWWRRHSQLDPDDSQTRYCLARLRDRIEPENHRARLDLIEPHLFRPSDNHGAIAAMAADTLLRNDDIDQFVATLEETRSLQRRRPFRDWNWNHDMAERWLRSARDGENDWTAGDRERILKTLARLRADTVSAAASVELALAPSFPHDLDRLLILERATHLASRNSDAWDLLHPLARRAAGAGDHAAAATLLTGLLQNVGPGSDDQMQLARTELRQALTRLGGSGLDVAADSPLAPLMEISLHLRLGDPERAAEVYRRHIDLVQRHRDELPVEILAFAANTHIDAGTIEQHEQAEDLLRSWIMENSEKEDVPAEDKARMQWLLARNYERAGRFEVARSEYTTLLNLYPETSQVDEASFGIGITFMEQKIFDEAENVFTELSKAPLPATRFRAMFLRGVLAARKGELDLARDLFRDVLAASPEVDLADRTLYELAEIYGVEQRHLDQLQLLRTVGRLGRESKNWHVPGHALTLVVQDTDLGISRGRNRIPVVVETIPGGDRETTYLHAGGAGRGLFVGELPTSLGAAESGDDVLQVLGSDLIRVEYPQEFLRQFADTASSGGDIRIAADAGFNMASQWIDDPDEDAESIPQAARRPEPELSPLRAERRPDNQIKPGNIVYLRLRDPDRSVSPDPDEVTLRVEASSGDSVEVRLLETGPVTGIFRGQLPTADLPAGALASDSDIDHSPLMALDGNPFTSWQGQPDSIRPKWLEVDMKQLHAVRSIRLQSPSGGSNRPTAFELFGSHDGRFFPRLASFPASDPPAAWPDTGGPMRGRALAVNSPDIENWDQLVKRAESDQWQNFDVTGSLQWPPLDPEVRQSIAEKPHLVVWQGLINQLRDGAVRFELQGHHVAAMVDGELVLPPRPAAETPAQVDLMLKRGLHQVVFAATLADPQQQTVRVRRARENVNIASVTPTPFQAEDFPAETGPLAPPFPSARLAAEPTNWNLTLPNTNLRHLRFVFHDYEGPSVAVAEVQVSGQDGTILPPDADLLALAENDILEIAPGDVITGSYVDQYTADGRGRNRTLTRTMTATYHNGQVLAIGYDFNRRPNGTIQQTRKEVRRIDPGTRIIAEVTDFDLDTTGMRDRVPVRVHVPGRDALDLEAVETSESSGIFHAEFDTTSLDEPAPGALAVSAGDVIVMNYDDQHNTFPGHRATRERTVLVRQPTDAHLHIIETTASRLLQPDPETGEIPRLSPTELGRLPLAISFAPPRSPALVPEEAKPIATEAPLTVEVMHPFAALDTSSTVIAEVRVGDRDPIQLRCHISAAHAAEGRLFAPEDIRHPALEVGRFLGQIRLRLGGPDSPPSVPASEMVEGSVIGGPVSGYDDPLPQNHVPVLNITGDEIIEVTYRIPEQDRPPQLLADTDETAAALAEGPILRKDHARLASDATLAITDAQYQSAIDQLHLGERLHLHIHDPDRDLSPARDRIELSLRTDRGEAETLTLRETLSHGGHFTGSLDLRPNQNPSPDDLTPDEPDLEAFFGDRLELVYRDEHPSGGGPGATLRYAIDIAIGSDGSAAAFSKRFHDENLSIQTRFHIAESYFELFKGQLSLDRREEAMADLELGRQTLAELRQDHPDARHAARAAYLLGQFSQELEDWPAAIAAYETVVDDHPEHLLAADAQYKLGQCYEKSGRFDEALEAYVTLAATYPKSPLIASVMVRIIDRFYDTGDYVSAAGVAGKFLERYPDHQWAPRIAFREGQAWYRDEQFTTAADAFDEFIKRFPDDDLSAQALFWAGESHRNAGSVPEAFRRYNRCRWDFPESDAAKYARGRLALPEMLAQFQREAQIEE